jgi:hypothetical protein
MHPMSTVWGKKNSCSLPQHDLPSILAKRQQTVVTYPVVDKLHANDAKLKSSRFLASGLSAERPDLTCRQFKT